MSNLVTMRDRVAFNQGPFATSPTWTPITSVVKNNGAEMATGRSTRGGDAEASSITLDVLNRAGDFTPFRNSSAYYPLATGAPFLRDCEYPVGSATYYPLWGGVLSDVHAGFEGAAQGTAQLTFQQRLAQPSKQPMRPVVVGDILASNPSGFWPLSDPAGSTTAEDGQGIDALPLTLQHVGIGGAADFGVGDAPGPDTGTRVALTQPNNTSDGYCFFLDAVGQPSIYTGTSTFDMAIVVNLDAFTTGFWPDTIIMQAMDDFAQTWAVGVHSDGKVFARTTGLYGSNTIYSTASLADGNDHAVGVSRNGAGNLKLWIDGVTVTSVASGLGDITPRYICVAGTNYFSSYSLFTSGSFANATIWVGTQDDTRHDLFGKSVTGLGTDTADQRFQRLCRVSGIPNTWTTTVGTFTRKIAAQTTSGRTLTDVLTELETAEGGRLSVDHQGRLVLASASAYYTPPRTMTLDASVFTLDDTFGTDTDGLVNSWTGNITGGETLAVVDETSISLQGLRSDADNDMPLATSDAALQIGYWKVNTTGTPRLRFPNVTVVADKLHAAGLLDDALALQEGDQLTLTGLPTAAPATTFVGFIERVAKTWAGRTLRFTFTLSEWIDVSTWDSATVGRWAEDPGSITLQSGITSAATSLVAVTAAGSPALTNTGGDLPFDIDVDGERMTVTAVSASTSPQTLTVTRAVAPSRAAAHLVGAAVSIHNPGVLGI